MFPRLVEEGSVYGVALPGYWLDIGTPDAYLQAHRHVLERNFVTELGERLCSDYTLVSPDARSLAVIGAEAAVGDGAAIEFAVVGAGATVGARTAVTGSIVGERAEVGADCEVRGLAVVGPGAKLGDRNILDHGLRIAAGETIAAGAVTFS